MLVYLRSVQSVKVTYMIIITCVVIKKSTIGGLIWNSTLIKANINTGLKELPETIQG